MRDFRCDRRVTLARARDGRADPRPFPIPIPIPRKNTHALRTTTLPSNHITHPWKETPVHDDANHRRHTHRTQSASENFDEKTNR